MNSFLEPISIFSWQIQFTFSLLSADFYFCLVLFFFNLKIFLLTLQALPTCTSSFGGPSFSMKSLFYPVSGSIFMTSLAPATFLLFSHSGLEA